MTLNSIANDQMGEASAELRTTQGAIYRHQGCNVD